MKQHLIHLTTFSRAPTFHKLERSSLNQYSSTRGSILTGNYSYIIDFLFPVRLSVYNPRSRQMYIVRNMGNDTLKAIFKNGFDLYKFENIVMVTINEFYDANLKAVDEILTICGYNPFEGGGVLFCRNITDINVDQSIADIRKFMADRFRNLKGYPYKVI